MKLIINNNNSIKLLLLINDFLTTTNDELTNNLILVYREMHLGCATVPNWSSAPLEALQGHFPF